MSIRTILFGVTLFASAVAAQAQRLTVIHNFAGQANPIAPLTVGPGGLFYGTTQSGGSVGRGTVFKIKRDGTLVTFVTFTGPNGRSPSAAGLIPDGNGNLYGTTVRGGSSGGGTVFKISEGTLTTLVNFSSGTAPMGLTIDNNGTLYGTTLAGSGTVFTLTTNGTLTTLVDFPTTYGSEPASLIFGNDNNLYGRTYNASTGEGTVFRLTTDGTLTKLATLSGCPNPYSTSLTTGLDGNFYGTTFNNGTRDRGTLFRMTPEGELTTLIDFDRRNGALPTGPLVLGDDGDLYGTTTFGGLYEGTVFKYATSGTLTTLANFRSRVTGIRPHAGVTFGADGSLYGTTVVGGSRNNGTVFRVNLPPTIVQHPDSQTNALGSTVTFTVSPAGSAPFGFQWLKGGTPLVDGDFVSGATSNTLTLLNIQPEDSDNYSVVINNAVGSVTSSEAFLTVTIPDTDEDGLPDHRDSCPNTEPGVRVNEHGCSFVQLVPCDGPFPGVVWNTHGDYVSAVAALVIELLDQGTINEDEAQVIITTASQSDCGKKF